MAQSKRQARMDEIAMECGRRLAECRRQLGLTQEQVSKATGYRPRQAGLSASRIGNFEQGTRRIGIEEAEILAKVFTGYPSAYFLCLIDQREAKMIAVLRSEISTLPPKPS